MKELEQRIGYRFRNKELLKRALTHSSYANETKNSERSNERLEFLGDSVLSIIVSEYIFKNYDELPEGELTKLRASLVCEEALCEFSREIGMGRFIKLGKGEQQNGGSDRSSILADTFEAVLAAMYLDGGFETSREYVLGFVKRELESRRENDLFHDYKTLLQEIIQRNPEEILQYVLVDEQGPDHDKKFTVEVQLNSNIIGTGMGNSKKRAEQQAAKKALELMGQEV
ncbi:MAG: ribonuclease III [Oscillospiraceae bacterium]